MNKKLLLLIISSLFMGACTSNRVITIKGSYKYEVTDSINFNNALLYGKVLDRFEEEGENVKSIIHIENTELKTKTDSLGNFRMIIPPGNYRIIVKPILGGVLRTRKIKVKSGHKLKFNFRLGATIQI